MQFRLSTLLWFFVVVWSSMAMANALVGDPYTVTWIGSAMGWVSITLLLYFGVVAIYRRTVSFLKPAATPPVATNPVPRVFLSLVVGGSLAYLAALGCTDPGELWRRSSSVNNLKCLGVALHSYAQEHGALPPAHLADKTGKPIHSWRAALLPFVQGDPNTSPPSYSFREPWDGPNNKKLLNQSPRMYVAPEDWRRPPQPLPNNASYVAIVGRERAWPGDKPLKPGDMPQPLNKTVWLIELANSNIAWTEPKDVSWDDVPKLLGKSPGTPTVRRRRIPSGFFYREPPETVTVLLGDGSVGYLSGSQLTPPGLQAALAVGGFVEQDGQSLGMRLNWRNCATLLVWTASIYFLLRRAVRNAEAATAETQPQTPPNQPPPRKKKGHGPTARGRW